GGALLPAPVIPRIPVEILTVRQRSQVGQRNRLSFADMVSRTHNVRDLRRAYIGDACVADPSSMHFKRHAVEPLAQFRVKVRIVGKHQRSGSIGGSAVPLHEAVKTPARRERSDELSLNDTGA